MQMNDLVIHEVGLRDGLQMESEAVPLTMKIQWTKDMIKAGIEIIQLGSFVNPKVIFQMADTDELFNYFNNEFEKSDNVVLSGLVLNERGLERGMSCGVDLLCMGVSASETHSRKNTRMSVDEAQERIIKMAIEAISSGKRVQASVQSAFGCGFEGKVSEDKVLGIVKRYLAAGINTISLADTAGHANPAKVERMFSAISELSSEVETACHFHNTYGMGLANVYAAYLSGVKYFESAFGGLGGCPFTKVAAGNVPTEDMVNMFQEIGLKEEIDISKISGISNYASNFFNKELPGFIYKQGLIKH